MRKPKKVRDAQKARVEAALVNYRDSQANGTLDKTYHAAKGMELGGRRVNLGIRMSPGAKQAMAMVTRFRQPMNAKGSIVKRKQSSLTDSEIYGAKSRWDGTQSDSDKGLIAKEIQERGECKVRIGTTPSRGLFLMDKYTGEEKFVRLKPQPKWATVGEPGVKPKDGGK